MAKMVDPRALLDKLSAPQGPADGNALLWLADVPEALSDGYNPRTRGTFALVVQEGAAAWALHVIDCEHPHPAAMTARAQPLERHSQTYATAEAAKRDAQTMFERYQADLMRLRLTEGEP